MKQREASALVDLRSLPGQISAPVAFVQTVDEIGLEFPCMVGYT